MQQPKQNVEFFCGKQSKGNLSKSLAIDIS